MSWEAEKNPATSISHLKNFSATSFVMTAEASDDDTQPTATPGGQSRASDRPESTVDKNSQALGAAAEKHGGTVVPTSKLGNLSQETTVSRRD